MIVIICTALKNVNMKLLINKKMNPKKVILVITIALMPLASFCQPSKYTKLKINSVEYSNFDFFKTHPEDVYKVEIELNNEVLFPPEIFTYKNLKVLTIYDFGGKELPKQFNKLSNLEDLNIEDCDELNTIPEAIGSLRKLKRLNIVENYDLQNIPDVIFNLPQLEELSYPVTDSFKISDKISQLKNLRKLTIEFRNSGVKKNNFKIFIPDAITKLYFLEYLKITGLGMPEVEHFEKLSDFEASETVLLFIKNILK